MSPTVCCQSGSPTVIQYLLYLSLSETNNVIGLNVDKYENNKDVLIVHIVFIPARDVNKSVQCLQNFNSSLLNM